ncbi:phytoene desaturase [Caldichromatium japonicum]|uniref:Phytoene desaturase n=1 Tax=Caldichromatium japonicum TaxID=2699430 RepID=A0A6G7VFG6_9GAMM|nr:1-hydroxycarotenoid 3,4-desaturase CrtD [Caldichromatium japonicum]QIK38692.1 phytoene desaturase [Caldichromatium japonicum]
MAETRAIVIGTGIGGLAAAIQLAARGVSVQVYERAMTPGGKLRQLFVGHHRIDAGPTVMTMRWIFEDLFAEAGAKLDEYLELEPLTIFARHAWGPEEHLDLYADREQTSEAIGEFAGPEAARGYLAFCKQAQALYETLDHTFIRAQRPSILGLIGRCGPRGIWPLTAVRPFASLWQVLGGYFKDPRLRQLFGRYATYCGSSPFLAPATLMLIAHVEQEGVWSVKGGMIQIPLALGQLAERLGVAIHYGQAVSEILVQQGRTRGVRLADRELIEGEVIIVNADPAALTSGRFGQAVQGAIPPQLPAGRSLSAMTWCLLAETSGFALERHNVFFGPRYDLEFDDIFGQGRLPHSGTVYLCAQDRGANAAWAGGAERLFLLLNAPACGDRHVYERAEIERCTQQVLSHLEHCGLKIQYDPGHTVVTTPTEFERLFPATGGGLYGQAIHGWQASFRRPASRTRIPGLYLAGGGTHPGAGIPMAATSGRLAAQAILQDLRLI